MLKVTAKIDGMACSMCESHVNDAVRKAFSVKKLATSHRKSETVILSEDAMFALRNTMRSSRMNKTCASACR